MREAVLALWPRAPISARSAEGRWLRSDRHPLGAVYLQRHARDEPCTPPFLLVVRDRDGRMSQEKHTTPADAVSALRRALGAREPARGLSARGALVAPERRPR
jgi:hypothetical protein